MTSSMLTGERRWASARRGMTVLGKVAVPKPINLPSQRLENHGIDPNVEIVPKGTLSWGTRSSSASNAWSSSSVSSNTDGGSSSASYLSGRPSSGGSDTRPSTAGSDRVHEPVANAWGPTSRPSSASGTSKSNQTSPTSLRPCSAETRPGSSQLSRFAEPSSENSGAWGGARTAEKLGATCSKKDGFSLASGDFPTLGSEKDNSGKNTDSQDHGSDIRPRSSVGVAPVKERTRTSVIGDGTVDATLKVGSSNLWRKENLPLAEDGGRPNMEKRQVDPQPYPNTGIPLHHYETWQGLPGPPVHNPPAGVWYRGPPPPGGPPYGPPLCPGGFPIEPFPYYRPQIPAAALANAHAVPSPGAGQRGNHPKNGDMYRAHMPDAYICPGMPIRPGFYPGPVAYEGYYSPPRGYCNSSERDIPFMGMQATPSAYKRYSNQNAPVHGTSDARSGCYGSATKELVSGQVESGLPHDTQGPYKVLLKHHEGWDGKEKEQKWEDAVATDSSYLEKGNQPRTSTWDDDWGSGHNNKEEADAGIAAHGEVFSQAFDNQGGSASVPVKVKSPESFGNLPVDDVSSVKELEHVTSAYQEVSQPFSATPKDSSLIQKIEGLNAKARASDGRNVVSVSTRKEHKNKLQVINVKANPSANEAATGVRSERTQPNLNTTSGEIHVFPGDSVCTGENSLEATTISRRSSHGVQNRGDHRGKARFHSQESDGWRKKYPVTDSSSVVSAAHFESSNVHVQDHHTIEATKKCGSNPQGKDEGESPILLFDSSDCHAQHAKMKELAKQRAKQLQMEEDERIRKQKAKALEKLEELNRRTQVVDALTQRSDIGPSTAILNKQEESGALSGSTVTIGVGVPSASLVSNPNIVAWNNETSAPGVAISDMVSTESAVGTHGTTHKESVLHNQYLPLQQDVNNAEAPESFSAPHVHTHNVSKQKRIVYKQKQNMSLENSTTENPVSASATEAPKCYNDVAINVTRSVEVVANEVSRNADLDLPALPNAMVDSSIHQRRRNNRNGKNKHKLEATSSAAVLTTQVVHEAASVESGKVKASEFESHPNLTQSLTDSKNEIQSSEQHSSLPNEEAHARVNNSWKSQHSHGMPRNPHVNKVAEKFHGGDAVVWKPVRSQNKTEVIEEASEQTELETATPSVKSDHLLQNNSKSKRAEMERYVPKPVAKEMAQQGSIQRLESPSVNQIISGETPGKAVSSSQGTEDTQSASTATTGKGGFVREARTGDSKQNKQGRGHGSWRQRAVTEATGLQGVQEGPSLSPNRNIQKSIEHQQPRNPAVSLGKEEPKFYDEWNASEGWNMPDIPNTTRVTVPLVKDKGMTGRGKRHPFKGHKAMGNIHDLDNNKISGGDTEKINAQSSNPEMNQTDLATTSNDNCSGEERSASHWQPKIQDFSVGNQWGSSSGGGGQDVGAEAGRVERKDSSSQGGVPLQPHHDQFIPEKVNVEAQNAWYHEGRRDRKAAPRKGRPHSPNQGTRSRVEPAPTCTDVQHEQHSSGFRKNGNQNSHFSSGQDSHGDWSSSGQDNKQQNRPANQERQRQDSHYEYQSVEGPRDGTHNTGSRFRVKGQGHQRRDGGNFYGRQRGSVRVDAGYD